MAIRYSLSAHPVDPSDEEKGKRVYANAQYGELVDLPTFARHIQEHGSPFTRDVIVGVLMAAVDCLHEQLLAGNKVNFGELGSFYVTLRGKGAERAEDFDPNVHVSSVDVNWDRSKFFDNLKNDKNLEWMFVPTRKELAEAKRATKEEANAGVEGSTGGDTGGGKPDQPGTNPEPPDGGMDE